VESVHLVAIRTCGRRQEAQDVSLAITDKYDNIPPCCAREWGIICHICSLPRLGGARLWYDDDTTTIDFGSVAVRTQTPSDPKLLQW